MDAEPEPTAASENPAGGATAPPDDDLAIYHIRVRGRLEQRWREWFGGLSVYPQDDGTTTLIGPLPDQAALHGVLERIRDLGLPLLSVNRAGGAECEEHNPHPALPPVHGGTKGGEAGKGPGGGEGRDTTLVPHEHEVEK